MGEIRIVSPAKTRGYPYPVCKKLRVDCIFGNKKCAGPDPEYLNTGGA